MEDAGGPVDGNLVNSRSRFSVVTAQSERIVSVATMFNSTPTSSDAVSRHRSAPFVMNSWGRGLLHRVDLMCPDDEKETFRLDQVELPSRRWLAEHWDESHPCEAI